MHFCTYFDFNYLVRFLSMYDSLCRHSSEAVTMYALCFDSAALMALKQLSLPGVVPIAQETFEQDNESLLAVKSQRSRVEYFFTCTPQLPLYVLEHYPAIEMITYVDADLFFFSSLAPIFLELGSSSVLTIPHRFPAGCEKEEECGKFNVAFLSFRRDKGGMACLQWWRDRCLEWCSDKMEEGKFADQKYLDQWPERFPNVHILQHKGADVAPWNVEQYRISKRKGQVFVDDAPLIFYHFQGFAPMSSHFTNPGLAYRGKRLANEVVRLICLPYVRSFIGKTRVLKGMKATGDTSAGICRERKDEVNGLSLRYLMRLFLQGNAVLSSFGRGWYCDSVRMRSAVNWLIRDGSSVR